AFAFFYTLNVQAQIVPVKQWDKTFGGNGKDVLRSLQQTTDGGYILGGTTDSTGINGDKSQNSNGGTDFWVLKTDAIGNKLWDKTFGGSSQEYLSFVEQT